MESCAARRSPLGDRLVRDSAGDEVPRSTTGRFEVAWLPEGWGLRHESGGPGESWTQRYGPTVDQADGSCCGGSDNVAVTSAEAIWCGASSGARRSSSARDSTPARPCVRRRRRWGRRLRRRDAGQELVQRCGLPPVSRRRWLATSAWRSDSSAPTGSTTTSSRTTCAVIESACEVTISVVPGDTTEAETALIVGFQQCRRDPHAHASTAEPCRRRSMHSAPTMVPER